MAPREEQGPSRYVVGLDLGTTNSAMASVETTVTPWSIQTFVVPQVVAPGQIEARESLPSFHYQPAAGEFSPGALQLGWSSTEPTHMVGLFARDQGTLAPARLINSAKSWLCHPGVDRTAELLPWQGAADVDRLSRRGRRCETEARKRGLKEPCPDHPGKVPTFSFRSNRETPSAVRACAQAARGVVILLQHSRFHADVCPLHPTAILADRGLVDDAAPVARQALP